LRYAFTLLHAALQQLALTTMTGDSESLQAREIPAYAASGVLRAVAVVSIAWQVWQSFFGNVDQVRTAFML
jgi:hypothetical protein